MNSQQQWAAWKDAIAALEAQGYRFINRGRVGRCFEIEVWRDGKHGATIREANYLRAVAVAAQHAEQGRAA